MKDKLNQESCESTNEKFDFVLWFFNWRLHLLRELYHEAFGVCFKIENAVNDDGTLKADYLEVVTNVWTEVPEFKSYSNIFEYVDLICEERLDDQVNDAELLLKLAICCHLFVEKIPELKPTSKKDIIYFVMADWIITEKINIMIGLLSERNNKTNPGAEAMKKNLEIMLKQ